MSAYRHCITESSADRQRQFEDALLDLMVVKPMAQIAIQEICDRVGLSRKSFYRYFSSKEACLNAMIDHAILDFTDVPIRGERAQEMLESFYSYWYSRAGLLDVVHRDGLGNLLLERAILCAVQEYGIRTMFQEENGSYERTIFFITGLFGVLLSWQQDDFQKTPSQLAASLKDFLPQYFRGIF